MEAIDLIIKFIVILSFVIVFINPVIWIIMVFVFFSKSKTLKSMIVDFDQNKKLSKVRPSVSGFYFSSTLDPAYHSVGPIERKFTGLKWIRNYLIIGVVAQIGALLVLKFTIFNS